MKKVFFVSYTEEIGEQGATIGPSARFHKLLLVSGICSP